MPRNVNPKNIKLGPGQTVPDRGAEVGLDAGAVTGGGGGGGDASLVLAALKAHIWDPKDAHDSSAIAVNPIPPLVSDDVESVLGDIVGGMPYEPPMLGKSTRYVDFHSVPDWGSIKLNDTPIFLRDSDFDGLVNTNDFGDVFPYYHRPPFLNIDTSLMNYNAALDSNQQYSPGFVPLNPDITPDFDGQVQNKKYDLRDYRTQFPNGGDVFADRVFNFPDVLGVDNTWTMKSGGTGRCYAGGFTRTDDKVQKTLRIMANEAATDPWPMLVTVSGSIYPADRGVIALLHFPHLDAPTSTEPWSDERRDAFLAQDVTDRCVAALLLGQGVLGDACIESSFPSASIGAPYPSACDGGPGGIFGVGVDSGGGYDPFAYPGRAGGQYNLAELHTGTSVISGVGNLPDPWDNLTGQGAGAGSKRAHYQVSGDDYYPAAGQVRLGSDPDAGTVLPWGIPILGGTVEAYMDAAALSNYTDYPNIPYIGLSAIHDTNFFKYRLPVLDDYSNTSGLKHTPQSSTTPTIGESYRYFEAPNTSSPLEDPYAWGATTTTFEVAGNYPPFQQDCTTWQVARYRHTFAMEGSIKLGSYAMFHFKSERDFEALMVDGTMPTNLYGIHFLTDQSNVVNENLTITDDPEYNGPIPGFGYESTFYNGLRDEVFICGDIDNHVVERGDIISNFFTWDVPLLAADPGIMWVSGVAYYTPKKFLLGGDSFKLTRCAAGANFAWANGYRTDDIPGDGSSGVTPPAMENSPNPAFMNLKCFGNDVDSDLPSSYPGAWYRQNQHTVEFPFDALGFNGSGDFSWDNGPANSDPLFINIADDIILSGDEDEPSFSSNAQPWFYIRRPLTHGGGWEDVIQPAWDLTNGHGFALEDTETVLLHTTSVWVDGVDGSGFDGSYGNFVKASPIPSAYLSHYSAFDNLVTAEKDVSERFLDEIYRYRNQYDNPAHSINSEVLNALIGPGMGTWHGGSVPIPTQAGVYHTSIEFPALWQTYGVIDSFTTVVWMNNMSWTQLKRHEQDLFDNVGLNTPDELQVVGLPPRNPKLLDWATVPFPSAGLLRYPVENYTATSYRPDTSDNASAVLRNYSTGYGTDLKSYVRVFDTSFSRSSSVGSTPPWDAAGQPFVTLRVDGLKLEDLQFTVPGLGTLSETGYPKISVQVKAPGLTTWMDAGRPDGSGPSKQDSTVDGAGCQIIGTQTFDGIDSETGMVYCQIRVNVGPFVNLSTGFDGEVPVMVRIQMNPMNAGEYDLRGGGPGTAASDVRGITGIKIVHPTEVETAPTT